MTDERRQAAEEWMLDAFRAALEDNFGSMVPTAMLAHEAGQECGEKRILDKLRAAVNEECSCGGCGPDDPKACQACMVWHRVTGGEG